MKVLIDSEELCIEAAKEVLAASFLQFENLLELEWEGHVNCWIDDYITEHYTFFTDYSFSTVLDECIGIELERIEAKSGNGSSLALEAGCLSSNLGFATRLLYT